MPLTTNEAIHWTKRAHRTKTSSTPSKTYDELNAVWRDLAEMLRPPERLTVTQAMEKYVHLANAGSWIGPYQSSFSPYMVQPADTLASRDYNSVIFVGPAQSGKTEALILGWLAYGVKVDPADFLVFSPTQSAARDFSMRRVARLHRNSPEIGNLILKNKNSDTRYDK